MLYQTQNTLDDQLNYNKNVRMSQKMAHAWNNLRLDRVNIRFQTNNRYIISTIIMVKLFVYIGTVCIKLYEVITRTTEA